MTKAQEDNTLGETSSTRSVNHVSNDFSKEPLLPPAEIPVKDLEIKGINSYVIVDEPNARQMILEYTTEKDRKAVENYEYINDDPNVAYPNEVEGGFPIVLGDMSPDIDIRCGPLLRLVTLQHKPDPFVLYTILIVVKNATEQPDIVIEHCNQRITPEAMLLHEERTLSFFRYKVKIPLEENDCPVSYSINKSNLITFFVPGISQTMRMMFHSCNGFSSSVEAKKLSGPSPLWRDVMRSHKEAPFHVMFGGGDQIYNDGLPKKAPLFRAWLSIDDLHMKYKVPFSKDLLDELERFYLEHYCIWFHQGVFSEAAAKIPMVNVWDDHDIIDGYGTYPDNFMRTPIFSNLGRVAFKYYTLFQTQSLPTEDNLADWDPSVLLGANKGPYIQELSRSFITRVGPETLFVGMDNRTERKHYQVNTTATYDLLFQRLKKEVETQKTSQLLLMLGVPISYPRLVWLENLLTSRILAPIKFLARKGIILKGALNNFDKGVEILDDLDDHWAAKPHKRERNSFPLRLQNFSRKHKVRITILSGDVHLAAVGRFYSHHHHIHRSKNIDEPEKDYRYMVNVISSAIVNTPPAGAISELLHRRNKIHHLDHQTDEDMVPIFDVDVDDTPLKNRHLLPRRNYCTMEVGEDKSLKIKICVEKTCQVDTGETKEYGITVPSLMS